MIGYLILQLSIGLLLLYFGAEYFLKGATGLARDLGISPVIIGMTIVGFGTSAPELAVNLSAAWKGSTDVALGNIVGSNIANIGLILGLSAMISPLVVEMRLLKVETPIMVAIAILLALLCLDGKLVWQDGVLFLAIFLALAIYMALTAKREKPAVQHELEEAAPRAMKPWLLSLFLIGGLAGLVVGADQMVKAAVDLARLWGLSELVIGLTIVAVGTSLPELASSAVAAYRGQGDIAVGNVVGSNIFNIALTLGATALFCPLPVDRQILYRDLPIMIGMSIILVPIMWRQRRISRREGAILFLVYLGAISLQLLQPITREGLLK